MAYRSPAKREQMLEHFRQVANAALVRHNANPTEVNERILAEAREDLWREMRDAARAREETTSLSPRLQALKDEQNRVLERFRGNVRTMAKRKRTKLHGAALKAHEKKLGKKGKRSKKKHAKKGHHHRRRACGFCGHSAVHHAKQGCLHHSGMKFCSCKHRS